MAVSYSIAEGYNDTGMCHAVKVALDKGWVVDAQNPLCERRFKLSKEAKSLGLSSIEMTLLPSSSYPDLMRKMLAVIGQEKNPKSMIDHDKDEKIIANHIKNNDTKIYEANFDPDNSGQIKKMYITDITLCGDKNSYWDGSVTTAIQNEDGSIDPSWGVQDATAGIPFIYENKTYYLKWSSLIGSVKKGAKSQLDIYQSVPYNDSLKKIIPFATFTPSHCTIYQMD
jgi:hypothetical protein